MSVFEYAYRSRDIATAIGVEFDKNGFLVPNDMTPERIAAKLTPSQLKALEYLISRFRAADGLNTRSPEFKKDTDEHRSLVKCLNNASDPTSEPHIHSVPNISAPLNEKESSGSTNDASDDEQRSKPERAPENETKRAPTIQIQKIRWISRV